MSVASDLLDSLKDSAQGVLSNTLSSLTVSVKTNLGPEFTVWSGAADGEGGAPSSSSVADRLGIKAAVIVRGARGEVLKEFGDYPTTEPVKVALALALALVLVVVLVRGVMPR